jgi:hypothetical protein
MQLRRKINKLLFGNFLGILFTKGGELAYDIKLLCHYTRQSHEATAVFWCQRVARTQKVGGPQLAGVCCVATLCVCSPGPVPWPNLCRVSSRPTTVARESAMCQPGLEHGRVCVCRVSGQPDSVATTAIFW